MAQRRREFVDSRLRRCPPDRASTVPYGQAGENALRFPTLPTGRRLPTSFTAPQQQQGLKLIPGVVKPSAGYGLSLFSPEPVQTTGTTAADRTSTATMRANQLRLWFASMAYVLLCALRRIGCVPGMPGSLGVKVPCAT